MKNLWSRLVKKMIPEIPEPTIDDSVPMALTERLHEHQAAQRQLGRTELNRAFESLAAVMARHDSRH